MPSRFARSHANSRRARPSSLPMLLAALSSIVVALGGILASARAAPAPAAAQDVVDELIQEFQRFYKGKASISERIEAIHVLAGADRSKAVDALLVCFTDADFTVRQAAIEVVGAYRAPECEQALLAILNDKRNSNALLKAGCAEALGSMKSSAAVDPLIALLGERDPTLVASAAGALGTIGDAKAAPALVAALGKADDAVKISLLDALGELKSPEGNAAALAQLNDKTWQVRAAAVNALGRIRMKESVQPLIDRLGQEDGRLRDDVAAALLSITTFDLGIDPAKWQTNWDRVKDRFQVPTDAEVAKAKAAFLESQKRYQAGTDDFAGIPTRSKRIIYVIDQSGSMEDAVLDKAKLALKDRTYSSYVKMEVVKAELERTISGLDNTVFFNVIAFATDVKPWKSGLVQANILNRNNAIDWIRRLKPIGGASQNLKKRAGLGASAGGGKGRTNIHDALIAALDAKAAQKGYDTDLGSPVDTIYFLTDGEPTAGPITEVSRILDEVRRVIQLRKVVIHTLQFGRSENGKVLMQELARMSGGQYFFLGE